MSGQTVLATSSDNEMLVVRPGKWTLVVISELRDGTRRFNQLRRSMGGVSQKSLTMTLRDLERDGFISRTAYATIPPRVDYALTEMGEGLLDMADLWRDFALRNRGQVEKSRAMFDASQVEIILDRDD